MVVFTSLRTSRSKITFSPVVRDSASNTILRLASRNCSDTGFFITEPAAICAALAASALSISSAIREASALASERSPFSCSTA